MARRGLRKLRSPVSAIASTPCGGAAPWHPRRHASARLSRRSGHCRRRATWRGLSRSTSVPWVRPCCARATASSWTRCPTRTSWRTSVRAGENASEQPVAEPIVAVVDPDHGTVGSSPDRVEGITARASLNIHCHHRGDRWEAHREKRQDRDWGRQDLSAGRVYLYALRSLLREEHGLTDLGGLRQTHCDAFDGFLRGLFTSVGRARRTRTVRSASCARSVRRRSPASAASPPVPAIGTSPSLDRALVRARKAGDHRRRGLPRRVPRPQEEAGRDQRPTPPSSALATFFSLPVLRGAATGTTSIPPYRAFPSSCLFRPDAGALHGMRREEFCALSVDDCRHDERRASLLHVCFNAFGRVKNAQSVRNLAVHPELIRLGFLDYVAAVHRLGHKRVFPDLFSPSTRSLLGDRSLRRNCAQPLRWQDSRRIRFGTSLAMRSSSRGSPKSLELICLVTAERAKRRNATAIPSGSVCNWRN